MFQDCLWRAKLASRPLTWEPGNGDLDRWWRSPLFTGDGGRGRLKLGAPLVLPRLCWTKQSSTRYVAEDCAQVSITYGELFFGTSWGLPFPGSGWSWAETILIGCYYIGERCRIDAFELWCWRRRLWLSDWTELNWYWWVGGARAEKNQQWTSAHSWWSHLSFFLFLFFKKQPHHLLISLFWSFSMNLCKLELVVCQSSI